ncbi:MAG: TRAP transporter substrate-binding protein DctP [Desulfuromusa sp.]|nr:TRAP transporter substrate-binding protein DctP [Desulfuromusa sp.]
MDGIDKMAQETLIQKSVGKRIHQLRKEQKLNAVELAEKAGISQGQLSKIENGKATISIKNLAAICRALDHPVSDLFQNKESTGTGHHPTTIVTAVAGLEHQGLHWFEREIARHTNGVIALNTLGTVQFGPVHEQIDLLLNGEIDLFVEELVHFDQIAPELKQFNLPYCFASQEKRLAFLRSGYFREKVTNVLLEKGIYCLNPRWNWSRGLERVIISNRPIITPGDLSGLRVRIYKSKILKRFWEKMGAIPVSVPYAEIQSAIDSGKVDAVPLSKELLYRQNLCRNARFVTNLGDLDRIMGIFITRKKYLSFSAEIQHSLKNACDSAGEIFSTNVKSAESKNESLNMSCFGAVYLKVDLEPWRLETLRIRKELMAEKRLSLSAWEAMENAC